MSRSAPPSGKGVALSVLASILFAVLSGYATLLKPLDGLAIFAWRIIWTFPGALLVITIRGMWPQMRTLLARVKSEPKLWLALPIMAALLGAQLWVFLWAPLHGQAMAVSMGYFLLPLAMVLVGRMLYGERLYRLQWIAVGCATVGALHELWQTHAFAWPTLLVAVGYPPYFVLRRWARLEAVTGFALEMGLMWPVAVLMLWQLGTAGYGVIEQPIFWLLLPGLGVISTVALICYLTASRLLPLGLLGILGYVEPVLLFVLAVTLLGESLTIAGLLTYVPIWLAVLLVCLHGGWQMRKRPRRADFR